MRDTSFADLTDAQYIDQMRVRARFPDPCCFRCEHYSKPGMLTAHCLRGVPPFGEDRAPDPRALAGNFVTARNWCEHYEDAWAIYGDGH